MNERVITPHQEFEAYLRVKNFVKAAEILFNHCNGVTLQTVTEILFQAHAGQAEINLNQLTGELRQRRRRIGNAIESLKKPTAPVTTKKQRETHNNALYRPY